MLTDIEWNESDKSLDLKLGLGIMMEQEDQKNFLFHRNCIL